MHRYHQKQKSKNINEEIYRNIQKRKIIQIVDKLIADMRRYQHKQKIKNKKNIKEEIYRNIQKRKTNQIINKLKRLKR